MVCFDDVCGFRAGLLGRLSWSRPVDVDGSLVERELSDIKDLIRDYGLEDDYRLSVQNVRVSNFKLLYSENYPERFSYFREELWGFLGQSSEGGLGYPEVHNSEGEGVFVKFLDTVERLL